MALVLMFGGFLAGWNLAWTALGAAAFAMVLVRCDTHEVLKLVDWNLLLFFGALFVVVEGLSVTGLPDQVHDLLHGAFGRNRCGAGLELRVVLGGRLERLFERFLAFSSPESGSALSSGPS